MNIKTYLKIVEGWTKRNAPSILTGASVAGLITTTVMAVRATPKAYYILEDLQADYNGDPPKIQIVKSCWKVYAPSFIMGIITATCMISANTINIKRNAALASLYSLSETALKTYQEKVVETIGEEKEDKIRQKYREEKIQKNNLKNLERTVYGDDLCFEAITGRYFTSDMQHIRRVVNDMNQKIIMDGEVTLNEFFMALGLDGTIVGNDMGWNLENRLEIDYGSCLYSDGTPCLYLDYRKHPIILPYCGLPY